MLCDVYVHVYVCMYVHIQCITQHVYFTYTYSTYIHLYMYIHVHVHCMYLNRFSLEKKISGEHYIGSMHVIMIGVEFVIAVLNIGNRLQ